MTNIHRVRTSLTGFVGAPGVITMYAADGPAMVGFLTSFWQSIVDVFPNTVTLQVQSSGDIIDDTTGDLVAAWDGPPQPPVAGAGAGAYAGPSGILVRWLTLAVRDGHRVRGRSFLVPAATTQYQADGSVAAAAITGTALAANAFVAAAGGLLLVWHRPRLARAATATSPALAAHPGISVVCTGADVPDKVVVLRSRRD